MSDAAERLTEVGGLDRVARPLARTVNRRVPRRWRELVHGDWLGHPAHPVLTDVTIGAWTSAWLFDLGGGTRLEPAAQTLVGLGVLAALPTAASGLIDFAALGDERRPAVVHAGINAVATAVYGLSWVARRQGRRRAGWMLGMAGASIATVGGLLGGQLSYGLGVGVRTGPQHHAQLVGRNRG